MLGYPLSSGKRKEPCALCDVRPGRLGPRLRLLRLSLFFRFLDYLCFLRSLHGQRPPYNWRYHTVQSLEVNKSKVQTEKPRKLHL